MSGWETLVAALGGLSVGVGMGILIGRRGEDRLRRRVSSIERRMRTTVVPILEGRADALGLASHQRGTHTSDPVELALTLGENVLQAEERQALPFSDTVEFTAGALSAPAAAPNEAQATSTHEADSIE